MNNSPAITKLTLISHSTNTPDYFIYSPDVYNGATFLGGWLTIADVGPDKLYRSNGYATDNASPLVWNGYVPYGDYHVNDPTIVQEANGSTLAMFVTALPNIDDSLSLMTKYNQTALITSNDGGLTWTWYGIVIGEYDGYANVGAWSPSALAVNNGIDLWYNTGSEDVVSGKSMPTYVLRSQMSSDGTQLEATTVCMNTSTNAPLSEDNVDIAMQSDNGVYWMVANDFSANAIVAFKSTDGINWTPWANNSDVLIDVGAPFSQFNFLTPTILSVDSNSLNIMVSEKVGDSTVEHTVDFNVSNTAPALNNFTVAPVVNGVQGIPLSITGDVYSGPVDYLKNEYIYVGSDNLNIVATSPSVFLRGGAGNDALVAQSGNNVLDGGGGSNFLTSGSGNDVFFLEVGDQTTWSTINNFHAGDQLTVWSSTAYNAADINWNDNLGAVGYTGATLTLSGNSSVTIAGWSAAQLHPDFGTIGGLYYTHFSV